MSLIEETQNVHHSSIEELLAKADSAIEARALEFKDAEDMILDYVGVSTREEFFKLKTPEVPYELRRESKDSKGILSPLAFGPEYFELLDLIDSIKHAKGQFVMMELGAGYGRWCVKANAIVKLLNPMPVHFTAVEAEPSHFEWLLEHFQDNGIDPKEHTLLGVAVSDKPGIAHFNIGKSSTWYGQSLANRSLSRVVKDKIKDFLRPLLKEKISDKLDFKLIETITLNTILKDHSVVDLIDLDIQGEELKVLTHSIDLLNQKVKRVHVATHSLKVERSLLELFRANGWKNTNLYSLMTEQETPYGKMKFGDGVQSWLNPKYY